MHEEPIFMVISPPLAAEASPARHFRTVFISDVHLGSRGCKAECLLHFLQHVEADRLYLVGDIVDGWQLKKRWFWPDTHAEILKKLSARARSGTEVIYLPGNHDEDLRKYVGRRVGKIRVVHDVVHETADGQRLLVVHGDGFDTIVREMKWLALAGSLAYDAALKLNGAFNMSRRWLGLRYWSLSGWLKDQVKAAVNFVEDYERALAAEARRRNLTGVICGHVHKPVMRMIDGMTYLNDGDWVENCTALVEHRDGRLEILSWGERFGLYPETVRTRPAAPARGKTAVAT